MLSKARLKEILSYCAETGKFTWIRPYHKGRAGKLAGSVKRDGYIRINIDGKSYAAHRLAWFYVNGELPAMDLDHINRDRSDNRICNLRVATKSLNSQNRSNVAGVTWHKRARKWQAAIKASKKHHYLGLFDSKEDARSAYLLAKASMHEG